MIKEFTLKNYSSFKNETTFTMEADTTNVSEYPEHYISFGDNNEILKVSSLYGPNGAGKSNLLKAFNHFKQLVFFGFKELEFNSPQAFIKSNLEEFNQFVLTNKLNNTMEFQLFTINNDYEIGYEIHYTKKDEKTSIVSYETMSYREVNSLDFTSIFKRTENGIEYYNEELSNIFNSLNIPISDKISFVSLVEGLFLKSSQTNKGIFDVLYSFYNEILNITFLGPERSFKKNDYNMKKIYSNSMIKDKVVKLLNFVGINIFDIVVEKEEEKLTSIYVIRKDDNNNKHYLNLQHESEGTITLFSLLPLIINKIEEGGVLIVDEIDAHLHPKLTKAIIQIFTSEENKNAQLIFSSHDILNMTNELFRRDEIWFVVKDQTYSSELIALTDIVNYKGEKVRKDAKYSKQYLEGRYGADPFINKGVLWNE